MSKLRMLILLSFFSASTFAQWKSHYPESELKKKEIKGKTKNIFDTHFFFALKAKSLEDYDQALTQFEKCIKLNDKNPTPFYESSLINSSNGNYDLATTQIKKAIKLEKENRWFQLAYAEILFKSEDFAKAANQYKNLILQEPGNEELYFVLSETYIYDTEFKKAIEVYDALEEHKGVDKILSMQKHKLYRQLNDMKGAIKELQSILDAFPNDIEVMEILSEVYLLNDEKEKAFDLFKKIAILDPENGRIHLTLADYYRQKGEEETSYNELRLAFKSAKLNIDTKIRILASYLQLIAINPKMNSQANELAELMLEIHPKETKAIAVYADILYINNEFEKAKQQYLLVLEKDKAKSQVWSQILFIQAEQSDFSGMLEISTEALEYFPADPLFYYFNGVSNKWFKNYEKAISSLEVGIEFIVENPNLLLEFYSSLADTYHAIKKHDLSDEYYEKALEIDPENALVLNNYAYYLSIRKKNLDKAKEMSFKSNEIELNNGTYQDTYAWILYNMKDYKNAEIWILKALENGSDNSAVVVEHYGDILYQIGRVEKAVKQWNIAKSLGEGSKQLEKKIANKELYE